MISIKWSFLVASFEVADNFLGSKVKWEESDSNVQIWVGFFGKGIMPNFLGLDKRTVDNLADRHDLDIEYKGMGVVEEQDPLWGTPIKKDTTITLYFRPPSHE